MADEQQDTPGGWLPPQSPGSSGDPDAPLDLGAAAQPPPGAAPSGGTQAPGWGAPAAQQGTGWDPPGAGEAAAWGQPGAQGAWGQQPGAQQPGAWGQPGGAAYGQQPYGQQTYAQAAHNQPSPWASSYYYAYQEPDNSPALAGFICSITSIGTLVVFFGILAPITLGVSIGGIVASRKGLKKVKDGETRKYKGLAQWGFWLGIAGVVLSLLAIAGWVALIATDPDAFDEDYDPDDGDPASAAIRAVATLARAAAALLG